jgi:hypothetical protein
MLTPHVQEIARPGLQPSRLSIRGSVVSAVLDSRAPVGKSPDARR